MLVVTADEMKRLEEAALQKGITAEMLMEEAGKQIAHAVVQFAKKYNLAQKALIVAGKGNNGGDGYVAARYLLQQGYQVQVWQTTPLDPTSLTRKVRRRFEARSGKVIDLGEISPSSPQDGVVIDGIFGTGFKGELDEKNSALFEKINGLNLPIIAIDIPSGVDASTGQAAKHALKATITTAIEYPKIGYYIHDGWNHVGAIISVPIGLSTFTQEKNTYIRTVEEEDSTSLLPTITRARHKYQAGHVVGLAGSTGMTGASLLASYASLKAGAGIVHLLHDERVAAEFAGSAIEVVKIPYKPGDSTLLKEWIDKASSCFIGPGFGKKPEQFATLDALWPLLKTKKVIIDADAITWLAKIHDPLPLTIITPHLGELAHLLGIETKKGVTLEVLAAAQEYADRHETHLVLKGGPTFLISSGALPQIVTRGDPGMATAGAGDVLTGILAALLAQGLTPREAMRLGVYIHGLAGEFAARDETSYCLTATSIVNHISSGYKALLGVNADLKQPWHITNFISPISLTNRF